MMDTPITNYLPSATIVLLAVVVLALLRLLVRSRQRCRELSMQVAELHRKALEQATATSGREEDTATEARQKEKTEIEEVAAKKMEQLPNNMFIVNIDQLITRNIEKSDFTAATVAKVLYLSRTQLDRRMKQIAGKTIAAYLLDKRMTYARELLLTTDKPIAEVAMACGFEDTSYFTRVFKQHYGNTPSGMRG